MNVLRGKVMGFKGSFIKPIAQGLLLLGATLGLSNQAVSSQPDHSYVVSVRNYQGEKLCNGVYIGGNQVMLYSGCETSPFPWLTIPPGDGDIPIGIGDITITPSPIGFTSLISLSTVPLAPMAAMDVLTTPIDYSDDEYPITFGGLNSPTQVVFTDENGIELPPSIIKRRVKNPYTGAQTVVALRTVPEGVRALPLASLEQIEILESQDGYPVQIISRDASGQIDIENRELLDYSHCQTTWPFFVEGVVTKQDPLRRNICLSNTSPTCWLPSQDVITYGAPIVATLENGNNIVVGHKTSSCQKYPSASDHQRWANLMDLKAQGLQVAMAYDLGERDKLERPKLDITFFNESADQSFDISNVQLFLADGFELQRNNCDMLEPGDSCTAKLKVDVSDSVMLKDMLTLTVNDREAGIYTAVQGIAYRFIKGDKEALWEMNGWKKKGLFRSGVYTNPEISSSPRMKRTRNIIDPKSMTIVYRLSGDSIYGAAVHVLKQEMFNTTTIYGLISVSNNLPGTNGEWVSKTIDVPVPGSYSIEINRMAYPVDEADEFNLEIAKICFGDNCQQ